MKTLLRKNPTLPITAPSVEVARSRALCAALAAIADDEVIAYATISESSSVIPAWMELIIQAAKSAARLQGFSIAPTGSGRQNAMDNGGRILNAFRREADFRWTKDGLRQRDADGDAKHSHLTERDGAVFPYLFSVQSAVKKAIENVDEVYVLPSQREEDLLRSRGKFSHVTEVIQTAIKEFGVGVKIADALAFVELDFVIDHRCGQVGRIRRMRSFSDLCGQNPEFSAKWSDGNIAYARSEFAQAIMEARRAVQSGAPAISNSLFDAAFALRDAIASALREKAA